MDPSGTMLGRNCALGIAASNDQAEPCAMCQLLGLSRKSTEPLVGPYSVRSKKNEKTSLPLLISHVCLPACIPYLMLVAIQLPRTAIMEPV